MERGLSPAFKLGVGVAVFLVGLLLVISLAPFTQVETGTVGIVMRLGKIDRVLPPGFHYKTPWLESVITMDTQKQVFEVSADAATVDKQQAVTTVSVNFMIDETKAADIYTSLRNDYTTRVIAPTIQESVKKYTARYTIDELLAKREEIKTLITESIKGKLAENDLIVTDVFITNFRFSDIVNRSIEATAQAKQDALKAEQELARVKFEAEQKIAQARADAESIRLQSDAANNPRYVELKKIEMMAKFAEKWNGQAPLVPTTLVQGAGGGDGGGFLTLLNLGTK